MQHINESMRCTDNQQAQFLWSIAKNHGRRLCFSSFYSVKFPVLIEHTDNNIINSSFNVSDQYQKQAKFRSHSFCHSDNDFLSLPPRRHCSQAYPIRICRAAAVTYFRSKIRMLCQEVTSLKRKPGDKEKYGEIRGDQRSGIKKGYDLTHSVHWNICLCICCYLFLSLLNSRKKYQNFLIFVSQRLSHLLKYSWR